MKRLSTLIAILVCTAWMPLMAQVNVSIQVLPPYPTKITDYASRPQLMVIAITSTSTSDVPQKIQLRGAITGDNGIELRAKDNYKSIEAIPLKKGETRMLNGADLKYFFDYTRISYKGITQQEFITKNGLPEGTYRICIRAYDYDSNAPLSADEPVGCSNSFTISSLEPPMLVTPMADATLASNMGQTVLFSWTTPPGTSPQIMSAVRYRIRVVEVFGDRNPNNAFMTATKPYFFEKEVMGNNYIYSVADPQLTPGRRYAFAIQAFDPFNGTPFRNNGLSEVRSFTYAPAAIPPIQEQQQQTVAAVTGAVPDCECKATAGTGNSNNSLIVPQAVVNVGNFKMHVTQVTPAANGRVNGEGTVELPFVGSTPGARLKVSFTDLDVDGNLKMKSGNVEGMMADDRAASLIPSAGAPELPYMQMNPADAQGLQQYFAQFPGQMMSAIRSAGDNAGFKLPIGISKGPVTIAIARIHFNATQAWFDAAGAVDIPDGGADNVLALSGRNICINAADGFCKQGQLYLSQDLNIGALQMVLKKPGTDVVAEPGTSIAFNKEGLVKLSISANYTFPTGSLTDLQTDQPLVANFIATTTQGWTDWLAQVKLPKFYIAGMKSITFDMADKPIFYDHSDFENPAGIPAQFTSPTAGDVPIVITPKLWRGFYVPQINVQLPAIIKDMANGNDGAVTIQGSQLIVDANGFTGTIKTTKAPLELGNGSMGGWYASIDNVNLSFFKSAFKESSMTGKVVLPASRDSSKAANQLNYSATLTTPADNSGLAYAFNVIPGNGAISFDALFMNVTLNGNTQILVQGNSNDPLKAEINLCGDLSILSDPKGVKIPGLGKLSLPHIQFENLKFQTYGDFINTDKFHFKLTSGADGGNGSGNPATSGFYDTPAQDDGSIIGGPSTNSVIDSYAPGSFTVQQKLAGFNFSLSSSGLSIGSGVNGGTGVNMSFNGDVSLAEGPIACKAVGTFTLSSGIKLVEGRIKWTGIGGRVDSVALGVGANLGAFKIKGAIKYYNKENDEGFVGALETGIADLLTINMRAQFGMITNSAQGDYNYFNFNAMADLGQTGITFAPPIPIAFYGFGGGIYYNMDIDTTSLPKAASVPVIPKTTDTKNVPDKATSSNDPKPGDDPLTLLDFNPAGLKLTPNKGSYGVQATVLFGLTTRNTLDADATFSIGFNEDGGLSFVKLNGNARILTDVSKPLSERRNSSTGAGSINIEFNAAEKTFLAQLDMELGVPFVGDKSILHATGGGEFFYAGKDNWHLKIGSPTGTQPGPNTVTVLNFIEGKSYFEVGTSIDAMPGIPDAVSEMAGVQKSNLKPIKAASRTYDPDAQGQNPSGMILGASASLGNPNTEYHFLMFFGTLYAETGFDLSLLKGVSCDNVGAAGGPGGWYARGQAYFGAKAKIGIEVDLLLIHGKFTIFEAGAGAIIQAGLPKPAWAEGTIGGYFSILDGAIASNFHFGFSVGEKCVNSNADAFGGLAIISQVSPPDGGVKGVPLTTLPGVVFNIKMGGSYAGATYENGDFDFDDYEHTDKNGNPTKRYFRFDQSCIKVTLNNEDITKKMVRLDSSYALGYKTTDYLAKNTQYTFNVVAKMLEGRLVSTTGPLGPYNLWYDKYVQKTDNSGVATQEMGTTFKTDSGFSAIPASEYAMTGPLHSHKAVPTKEFGGINGTLMYVESKRVIDNTKFFKYPEGTTYWARVFRNGVKDGADRAVTMQNVNARLNDGVPNTVVLGNAANLYSNAHSRWTFPAPVLQKGSGYVVTIIAKLPQTNSGNGVGVTQQSKTLGGGNVGIDGVRTVNSGVLTDAANTFQINTLTRTLANRLNSLAGNESIVAAFNFRTSNYETYWAKFSDMRITKMVRNDEFNTTITPDRMPGQNIQVFKNWMRPQVNSYNIKLGSSLAGFNFPVKITFVGELFNKADIEGTNSDEVFQPDYGADNSAMQQSFSIKSLYKKNPETDYGAQYVKMRTFIANNTSIPVSNISVTYTSAGSAEDNGATYTQITGGEDVTYSTARSNIGGKIPTALPQVNNNIAQIGETGLGNLMANLPMFYATPVLFAEFTAENKIIRSRGQVTFTNAIQKQIDKVTNWAVNPGDNAQMNGVNNGAQNVMTGGNMSNVGVWEGISSAAGGFMNGSINQNQLQGAIQGAARIGAGVR